ncbi:MAG: transposase [Candidatus Marinimicrobia bacterium]|nr:transposase [Candidatus Neomarinimicrobiota bacterium]
MADKLPFTQLSGHPREWIRFYNHERTHQSLGRQTPEQVYLNSKSSKDLAA